MNLHASHLHFDMTFACAPQTLWDVLQDHEGMSDWVGAQVRVIAGDGGVGTVRRIESRGLAFDETIVYLDAPHRLVYRITRGLPIRFHRGEIIVAPWGQTGARLQWDILLDSQIPLLAHTMAAMVDESLTQGLHELRIRLSH